MTNFIRFILAGSLMLAVNVSYALSLDDLIRQGIFQHVVQGHHGNNNDVCHKIEGFQLLLDNNASIINGTAGLDLDFCSVNDYVHDSSCDDGKGGFRKCTVDGSDIRSVNIHQNNFLGAEGWSSDDDIPYCNAGQEFIRGDNGNNNFNSFAMYSACTVTMSPTHSDYHINTLAMGSGAKLILPKGNYWISDLQLQPGSLIELQGDVHLFIEKSTALNGGIVNDSGDHSLMVFAYNDITLNGSEAFNGYLYSDQTVTINIGATVNGRVTSRYLVMHGGVINDFEPEPVEELNHYRIEFTSGALSCAAKEVRVRACENSDCTTESSVSSYVELTVDGSKYSDLNFVGNTSTGVWHPQGGTALLGIGGASPSAPVQCYIDGSPVANDQCLLTFEDSGLYFDVPDTISAKNSDDFTLYAVKKDTQTQQCQALFSNENKRIDFSFDYERPSVADGVNNPAPLTLNSVNSPSTTTQIAGSGSQSLNVQFDVNGKASLNVNYPEAGVVRLSAELIHSVTLPTGDTETLDLVHSDPFTAAPAGFHFFNVSANNRCDSSDPLNADCKVLTKAGEGFPMQVKAVAWQSDSDNDFGDNVALQNFQFSALPMQAKVDQPSAGSDGTLAVTESNFNLVGGETAQQIVNQSWDEVGTMKVELASDISYEGVNIAQTQSSSELFGRFIPAYLEVIGNRPEIAPSCTGFTYMDQPFSFVSGLEPHIKIRGFNMSDSETYNYQIGDWWRYKRQVSSADNSWPERQYQDSSDMAALEDVASPSVSGTLTYIQLDGEPNRADLIGAEIAYLRTKNPVVPFAATFDLVLSASDVSDEDGVCYQVNAAGECQPYRFENIGQDQSIPMMLRYGRMVLDNGYGPESESLRLPVSAQYVANLNTEGKGEWQSSSEDNCSVYQTFDSADSGEESTTGLYMTTPSSFPGISVYGEISMSSRAGSLIAGKGYLYFSIPNSAGEIQLKQHVEPWLKWFWNFDGDKPDELYDPRATGYLGTYRGHDKVIFWREVN